MTEAWMITFCNAVGEIKTRKRITQDRLCINLCISLAVLSYFMQTLNKTTILKSLRCNLQK